MKAHIFLFITCIMLFYLNLTPVVGTYRSYFYVFISSGLSFYTSSDYLLKDFASTVSKAYDYKQENTNLKNIIANDHKKIVELESKITDNKFNDDQKNYSLNQTYVVSNLIGVNEIQGNHLFTIDKGSARGIEEKNTVVYKQYLVGTVVEANTNYSVVKTVESSNLQIPSQVLGKDIVGLYSCLNYTCYFDKVLTSSDLKKGDFIVTSGVSGEYTKDYIIGVVDKIQSIPEEPFKKATVSKLINLNSITKMSVILNEK